MINGLQRHCVFLQSFLVVIGIMFHRKPKQIMQKFKIFTLKQLLYSVKIIYTIVIRGSEEEEKKKKYRRLAMGRSNLQGSAWHYEYIRGREVKNSKNCVFNTGTRCSCKISPKYNQSCVGKAECEEFERSSFRKKSSTRLKTESSNPAKVTGIGKTANTGSTEIVSNPADITRNKYKQKNKKCDQKNSGQSTTVRIGSKISVLSIDDREHIRIGAISSVDNPFYLKKLGEVVTVKGIRYKVEKIY